MNDLKKRCVLICGSPKIFFPQLLKTDFIIACDYGYKHAIDNNIIPNLIVGDFDSYTDELPNDISIISAPSKKDDTDTLLAVKTALDMGFTDFLLLGVTGGRFDHQIANYNIAAYIANSGASCKIIDHQTIWYTIKNTSIEIEQVDGYSLSVISHTDTSLGVTIENSEYELTNSTINNLFPVGVSNNFIQQNVTISVKEGILHIILSKL